MGETHRESLAYESCAIFAGVRHPSALRPPAAPPSRLSAPGPFP